LTHQNEIYAFGLGLAPQYQSAMMIGLSGAAADAGDKQPKQQRFVCGATNHKKLLHCYKVAEQKWMETNESIFSGQRRESDLEAE